jgi:S1-C subfamily serine protease
MQDLPPNIRALRSALLLLVLIAFGLIGYLLFRTFGDRGTPAVEPRPIAARGDLADIEKATINLFRQSAPSVVFITTVGHGYDLRMRPVEIPAGTGSGFIWDDAGDIVTNFHVIQSVLKNGGGANVTLGNHRTYPASLVGTAPEYDLAVLRISAPKGELAPLMIGSSSDLQVGQWCFAIGNPFGLDQTLTTGVVSATGRTIQGVAGNPIEDVIQTDAAINPGNSGGPLLDSAGRLIGVNTAIYSQSGSSAGIGFAVPVDTVNRVVPQLIASGRIVRPRLGVVLDDRLSEIFTREIGVPGVMIVRVQPDSAAARAGLRGVQRTPRGSLVPGDVIQQIDGRPVRSRMEYFTALGRYAVGDRITLTINRLGETLQVPVTLDGETPSPD